MALRRSLCSWHRVLGPGRRPLRGGGWRMPALAVQRPRPFHATALVAQAAKRDFYEVLGLARDAKKADVKKKYFEMAKKFHPDANKEDPRAAEKFQEAKEAYEVLSDEEKRQIYDNYGHAGVDASRQGGGGDPGGGFGFDPFAGGQGGFHFEQRGGNPEDFERFFEGFNDLFGQGGRRRGGPGQANRPYKGVDHQAGLVIDFFDAVQGAEKQLPFEYIDDATGKQEQKIVTIQIPAGVYDGVTVRLTGEGGPGINGGPPGDVFVRIRVQPDNYFKREDDNIFTDLPVSLAQAVLGGTAEVLTLDGMVELKIPEGTQTGTRLVIRNRGVQRLSSSTRGHHFVQITVQVPKPKELSERQLELMREFQAEEEKASQPWFQRWTSTIQSALESLGRGSKP